jgi:hypothetical protein
MLAGQFALIVAAVFTGAALIVSVAEQPARLGLDDRAQLVEWTPSYKRAQTMQAPLAIIGFLFGVVAWSQTGNWRWITGADFLIANWVYTIVVIFPINERIKAIAPAKAGLASRALIKSGESYMLGAARSALLLRLFFYGRRSVSDIVARAAGRRAGRSSN